jgi:hypothetical protein
LRQRLPNLVAALGSAAASGNRSLDFVGGYLRCSRTALGKGTDFIGDDRNDTEVMKAVGLAVCPASAVASIKSISDIVLSRKGGAACVREFIDNYLS